MINRELTALTDRYIEELRGMGSELNPVASSLSEFILDGGKRFRPLFSYLGYLGAGASHRDEIVRASAALELVHVCALIHDDVMDGSDTRRNKPAIHKTFESLHRDNRYSGDSTKFGIASAILIGDLALVWGDRILRDSGISSDEFFAVMPIFTTMRDELMAGQYLDVLEGALATTSVERSLNVARYKSGKYSIERPLHFGATLAGGSAELLDAYSSYGLPLGEAFQLRDDILGVFGDPGVTGKPAGDDLREGKRTVLLAMAMELADTKEREDLTVNIGRPDLTPSDITRLQSIIESSGARARCEALITSLTEEARLALRTPLIDATIATALDQMAELATQRSV